jgi:hypothetical protein
MRSEPCPERHSRTFSRRHGERVLHVADCARCGGGGPRCSPLPQKYSAPLQPGGAFFCPRFSCRAFTIYFLREHPVTAPQRNSDINRGKDELDIGSLISYAMAHQQRIIFQRRHSRRHFQTHPLEYAASIPRDVGNGVSRPRTDCSREAPCRRAHMAQVFETWVASR